jgi:DNA-directed RNA polymerase subunit RPC12/RpoP
LSSMLFAARSDPEGLGRMAEDVALAGQFEIPSEVRLTDKREEQLLLISTVEELVRHEIALRDAEAGPLLIFPSEMTRERKEPPKPAEVQVAYIFEGPVQTIYTSLVIRLSNSVIFPRASMWKNAAEYAPVGGRCGIYVRQLREGRGEILLFFDAGTSEETQYNLDKFVFLHLSKNAIPDTVTRRRNYTCHVCGTEITDMQVAARRARKLLKMECPVCDSGILLEDREERIKEAPSNALKTMEDDVAQKRDEQAAAFTHSGKVKTDDIDVFFCHNTKDKPAVKEIASALSKRGLYAWLDESDIRPGSVWQVELEKQIKTVKSVAVFIGSRGAGPWQTDEFLAFQNQSKRRKCRIIPVILKDCPADPKLPPFLEIYNLVDFRREEPDPISQLVWGITGKRAI